MVVERAKLSSTPDGCLIQSIRMNLFYFTAEETMNLQYYQKCKICTLKVEGQGKFDFCFIKSQS